MPATSGTNKKIIETPVLIIGAGPVGMALALDLAWRGIGCMLIERTSGEIRHSKIGLISARTMEICRRLGIAQRVRDCGFPMDLPLNQVFCTSLAGYPLSVIEFPSLREETMPAIGPEKKHRCPQLWFNPILGRAVSEQSGIDARYHCELESFDQGENGVRAKVRDLKGGDGFEVSAQYMVACDGAGSSVRQALGIVLEGDPALSYSTAIYLRSPGLPKRHDKGPAERYLFIGPEGNWGHLTVVDGQDYWRMTVVGSKEKVEAADFDAAAWVRRGLGSDDIPFEIDSVMPWRRSRLLANSYGKGRVFIAGDAAHVMAPNGGYGMNTGITDIDNLGWKLEATLGGWAGAKLLASYDAERRPVGQRMVDSAAGNFALKKKPIDSEGVLDATPEGDAKRIEVGEKLKASIKRHYETLGADMGHRYEGSPVIVPDGTPQTPDDQAVYVPTARPGHRSPHGWLADGRSTLDLFGRGFALLQFGSEAKGADAILAAAKSRGVPVTLTRLDDSALGALYERKLALVRPDGHVAWRGDAAPADAGGLIDTVRGAA